jgi:hypothetical protein
MQDSTIKNVEQYRALLEIGYSKEKAASIANATSSDEKGGNAKPYDLWTKEELYQQARIEGVPGRSYMNKKNLIKSLRHN